MQRTTMKLLVYSSDRGQRKRLLKAINAHASRFSLETFRNLTSLSRRLRSEFAGDIWTVLITVNTRELNRLIAMNELIGNKRNILVLPNQNIKTVAAGHRLYPRLISHLDSDYREIGLVLEKVIRKKEIESQ